MRTPSDQTEATEFPSIVAAAVDAHEDDSAAYVLTSLRHASAEERGAALGELVAAWGTFTAEQLDRLYASGAWQQLASPADLRTRVALAAGVAAVAEEIERDQDPMALARSVGMLRALDRVGLVGEVHPRTLEIVVESLPDGVDYLVSGLLARWLVERAYEAPALVSLVLAFVQREGFGDLAGVCAWLDPTSDRMLWAAHEATRAVFTDPSDIHAIREAAAVDIRSFAPSVEIADRIRAHATARHVARALHEKPVQARDAILAAGERAWDPLLRAVLWTWSALEVEIARPRGMGRDRF